MRRWSPVTEACRGGACKWAPARGSPARSRSGGSHPRDWSALDGIRARRRRQTSSGKARSMTMSVMHEITAFHTRMVLHRTKDGVGKGLRTHNLGGHPIAGPSVMYQNSAGLIILTWTGCTALKQTVQHPAAAGLALCFAALGSWLFGVMKVIIFQARCWRSRRLGTTSPPPSNPIPHHQNSPTTSIQSMSMCLCSPVTRARGITAMLT